MPKKIKKNAKSGKRFIGFRVDSGIYTALKNSAEQNNRSLNGEIRHRLSTLVGG